MNLPSFFKKQKYDFTFLKNEVKEWKGEITMNMLNTLPYTICFFVYPHVDDGGNQIYDIEDYLEERKKYIEYLYIHFNK